MKSIVCVNYEKDFLVLVKNNRNPLFTLTGAFSSNIDETIT